MTTAFQTEIQKLSPSARVEMFEVDLTALGDTKYYFHGGTNQLTTPVVWQGITYNPYPVVASGFDYSVNGQLPRPKLQVANANGMITTLVLAYQDLVGGKVTRRVTLAKFLDAVNFNGGNPNADPLSFFPDEVYYIDRKSNEDKNSVEFELAAQFDVTGVQLPRRQIIQNTCVWKYRGAECGFTGGPISAIDDLPFTLNDASTSLEVAYFNAYNALLNAYNTLKTAISDIPGKESTLDTINSGAGYIKLAQYYTSDAAGGGINYVVRATQTASGGGVVSDTTSAFYNGAPVTIGNVYRKGSFSESKSGIYSGGTWQRDYYVIEVWGVDTAAQSTANTNLTNSYTSRTTAETNYNSALAAYNAAIAALPANSPLLKRDKCGKRISSCKLRFGNFYQSGELPFGGFPGAGLIG